MSVFLNQVGVANHIEKFQWDFLWGGVGDQFEFYLVSLSKICTLISSSGLRVRNLLFLNRALLGKSLCCYATKREALCDWLWMLYIRACGKGGVLMRLVDLTVLGCGIILGGVGGNSLDLFDLRCVMVLR